MNKKFSLLIKILFTLSLFYIIFKKLNLNEFYPIFFKINPYYLIILPILWGLSILLSGYKWNLILSHYKLNIAYKEAFNLYWIGSFFNNFLPSSFGGDGYKLYALNKKFPNKKGQILSSMVLERGIGFFTLILTMLIFGSFFISKIFSNPLLFSIYFGSFISTLILVIIFICFSNFEIEREFKNYFLNKIVKLYNILVSFKDKKILMESMIISLIFILISVFSFWCYFKAFNYEISFLLLLFLIPLIQFSELVPFTINSLGIKEGLAIYLFYMFSIHTEVVLAVYVIARILSLMFTSSGGLAYIYYDPEKKD